MNNSILVKSIYRNTSEYTSKEGNVEEVTVFKGVDPHLDAEALRVIKMMPKWKPGKHEGKEVNVKCTIPVGFRLQ